MTLGIEIPTVMNKLVSSADSWTFWKKIWALLIYQQVFHCALSCQYRFVVPNMNTISDDQYLTMPMQAVLFDKTEIKLTAERPESV